MFTAVLNASVLQVNPSQTNDTCKTCIMALGDVPGGGNGDYLASEGKNRKMTTSSNTAYSTQQVPGYPRLQSKTLSNKQTNKTMGAINKLYTS